MQKYRRLALDVGTVDVVIIPTYSSGVRENISHNLMFLIRKNWIDENLIFKG